MTAPRIERDDPFADLIPQDRRNRASSRLPEVSDIPRSRQREFDAWVRRNQVTDLDSPDAHYDYRGAFLAGVNRDRTNGHWPDTFKQHGHPTFSVESRYSTGPDDGGSWKGDVFMPPKTLSASQMFSDVRSGGSSTAASPSRLEVQDPFADLVPKHNDPTLLDQAKEFVTDVGKGIGHFATHPWELVTTPAHEAADALFTPVEGSESSGIGGRGGRASLPAGTKVTKKNTPGAITPDEQRRAALQATIDVPLLLAGGGSKLLYPGVAASGAVHNPEHPIKGAAEAVAGVGVIHAATKLPGVADVSDGMVEAGTKDLAREAMAEQAHYKTGMSPRRRPAPPPPIEPPPNATGVSVGETPLRELGPAGRSTARWLDIPSSSIGELRRRPAEPPVPQVTPEQVAAQLHPDTPPEVAVRIADSANRNALARAAATAHYPREADLSPVASANGEFVPRPGVMRKVNADRPALPSSMRLPPEATPADLAAAQPEGVKRISPEEVARREAEAEPEQNVGLPSENLRGSDGVKKLDFDKPFVPEHASTEPPARGRKAPDLFDEARTKGGDLRPFHRVSDDGLVRELTEYQAKIVDAQQRAQYNWTQDENFHSTEDGRAVVSATRIGGKGVSQQAKAIQNLQDYDRIMKEIEGELAKRGHTSDTIFERQQHLSELDASLERDAIERANDENDADMAFDLGDEPTPGASGDLGDGGGRPPARTAAGEGDAEPPISDILNVAKLDLVDKSAEERVASQLEKHRALRDSNRQTFGEADANRAEIVKELVAGDGKALSPTAAKRLSGEELLARRDVVRQNDQLIADLSKAIESKTLPIGEHEQAQALVEKAIEHNDALLSDLVTGSSQKGRDLNLLRRIANRSLDPDVWQLQAKRLLGDRPLTDEISTTIRRLAREAADACGGAG